MQTTIDSAGRLVIPKSLRDEAGLDQDVPVEVTYRDGHIEVAPAPREVTVAKQGRVTVARPRRASQVLSDAEVRRTRQKLRDR